MREKKDYAEELAKNIKKKAIRKYALIALALVIVVSTVIGLNIESKDSKLPDGQGNIITNEAVLDEDKNDEKEVDKALSSDKEIENTTVDKQDTDKNTMTNKPSADKNTTTSTPSADKNTTTSTPSADKNTTTSKPSADKKPSAEDLAVDNSKDPTASNGGNSAYKPDTAEKVTVTINIRCDTLSSDMSKLTNDSIAGYIPSNGIILGTTTYKGTTDNTVFDVLNTVCRNNGIQLESSYTPMYESYYVEGINYLYEFDGGPGSGWMYKVNGWYPNYGCSSYYLSDGDVIEWVYTCDYGVDVGGTLH